MSDQEDVDDFLAHYGVLGMKWGVRKSVANRVNAHKTKRAAKVTSIKEARERYETSARANYLDAKANVKTTKTKYKADKARIKKGYNAAQEALKKVEDQNLADAQLGSKSINGKERASAALVYAGTVGVAAVLAYRIASKV